jgi:PEP-CTERM motif-containing protein
MKRLLKAFILLTGLLVASVSAQASPYYTSSVQDIGSGKWQYDYTVTNDLSASVIREFNIYFNPDLYQLLEVVVPGVSGWTEQVVEPVPFTTATIPQDGFFNAIAGSGMEIGPLASLGGFSVSFEWLGFDTPSANDFQGFDYLTAPYTGSEPPPVPEPGTFLLLGAGIAGLAGYKRMTREKRICESSI